MPLTRLSLAGSSEPDDKNIGGWRPASDGLRLRAHTDAAEPQINN